MQDEQTISAADVGDVAAVLDGPAPRDVRPIAAALAESVEAAVAATGARVDIVLAVAVALGTFGITRSRAVALAAAVAVHAPDPMTFLETCRQAYNAALPVRGGQA